MIQKMKIQKRLFLFLAAIAVGVTSAFAQDVITLKNGKEMIALVYEIGDTDVKYKKIENPSGPNYTLKISEIFMIEYANGSKDMFDVPMPTQPIKQAIKPLDNISKNVGGIKQQPTQNYNVEPFEELVETAPEYPGGTNAIARYFSQNFRYPKNLLKKKIPEGRVVLRFLVKANGSTSDIHVIEKLHWECDSEAIRLIQNMPKWIPAKLNGKPVKAYYSLPIEFKLK